MTKVMRKEARHTQRRDRASGVPLEILEHIPPKPESAYFLLVLSPKPLTLRGALPPRPVLVAGNIGTPLSAHALDFPPDGIVVAEVSSFQLETIELDRKSVV